jgi:F-type H+-transporting ATPase subunit b
MEDLALDYHSFFFQVINFGVLLWLLNRLLSKPLLKLLDTRRHEIEESLKAAEHARSAAAKQEEEQEKIIHAARTEAHDIVEEARRQASLLGERMQKEAEAKAAKTLAQAELEIAQEKARINEEVRTEVAHLILQTTNKVLDNQIEDSTKQHHLEKIVTTLGGSK